MVKCAGGLELRQKGDDTVWQEGGGEDGGIKVRAGPRLRVCREGDGSQSVAGSCCGLLTCWGNG